MNLGIQVKEKMSLTWGTLHRKGRFFGRFLVDDGYLDIKILRVPKR